MNYETALQCAQLSQDIYTDFAGEISFMALPKAASQLIQNRSTDTQLAVLEDPASSQTVIVFRGSENDKDWETNLQLATREQSWQRQTKAAFREEMKEVAEAVTDNEDLVYPEEYGQPRHPVKMHQGFIKAYLSIRDEIHAHVEKSETTQYRITGHSLGGAIAALCAVDLQYNFGQEIALEVYTFGAPRVGNGAFADSYNQRVPDTWRFVNGWDAVVGLPAPWQGYRHVDEMIKLARKFTWKIITGSFEDHKISRYIDAIKEQI